MIVVLTSYQSATASYIRPMISEWVPVLGGIIAASDDDGLIDCGLKTDAIKAIAFLTMAFPKLVGMLYD